MPMKFDIVESLGRAVKRLEPSGSRKVISKVRKAGKPELPIKRGKK
jgi:hypothetical protein